MRAAGVAEETDAAARPTNTTSMARARITNFILVTSLAFKIAGSGLLACRNSTSKLSTSPDFSSTYKVSNGIGYYRVRFDLKSRPILGGSPLFQRRSNVPGVAFLLIKSHLAIALRLHPLEAR